MQSPEQPINAEEQKFEGTKSSKLVFTHDYEFEKSPFSSQHDQNWHPPIETTIDYTQQHDALKSEPQIIDNESSDYEHQYRTSHAVNKSVSSFSEM